MTTTKSFSDNRFSAFYRSALKRQFSFGVAVSVILILLIPVFTLSTLGYYFKYFVPTEIGAAERLQAIARELSSGVLLEMGEGNVVVIVLAVIALAAALVVNSYMHSKKQVDFYHALPVRRSVLLGANMLATLTSILAPFIVLFFLTMGLQLIFFGKYGGFTAVYFQNSMLDFLTIISAVFVVYAFTTFMCVQVGTVFDALVVSGAIGFIPALLYLAGGVLWNSKTYGASFRPEFVCLLSPFLFFFDRYRFVTESAAVSYDYAKVIVRLLAWVVIGALLLAWAFLLYNRRGSEAAGQTQRQGVLQTIVKCFAAFCGALLFYAILRSSAIPAQIVGMLIGGMLTGLVAELVFSRGVRNLRKNVRWMVTGGVLACLLLVCVSLDVVGYVGRVPAADDVAGAVISYNGRFYDLTDGRYSSYYGYTGGNRNARAQMLTNPESIAAVLDMHRLAVSNVPPDRDDITDWEEYAAQYPYRYVNIVYTLKNGRTVRRTYSNVFFEAYEALSQLEDKDDFIKINHPVFIRDGLTDIPQAKMIASVVLRDSYGGNSQHLDLNDAQLERLVGALQEDLLSESLEEILSPSRPAAGLLTINYLTDKILLDRYGQGESDSARPFADSAENVTVVLTQEYAKTLRLLEDWGYTAEMEAGQPERLYVIAQAEQGDINFLSAGRVNAAVASSNNQYYLQNIIDLVNFGNRQDLSDMFGNIELFEVAGSAEIASINAGARSHRLLGRDYAKDTVLVVAEYGGKATGYKLIETALLPPALRERVTAHVERTLALRESGETPQL